MPHHKNIDNLIKDVVSIDNKRRREARSELIRIGGDQVIAEFISLMSHGDPQLRAEAAFALSQMGEGLGCRLRALLQDPDENVRHICARTLRSFEPDVLACLESALEDTSPRIIDSVCYLISAARHTAARPKMRSLLQHGQWTVRRAACQTLFDLGDADHEMLETATELSGSDEASNYEGFVTAWRNADSQADLHPTVKLLMAMELRYRIAEALKRGE